MNSRDIVLNIAVNMGRIGRFAQEGQLSRVKQFLTESREYLSQLPLHLRNPKFEIWLKLAGENVDPEEAYTWSNILTHQAKLIS